MGFRATLNFRNFKVALNPMVVYTLGIERFKFLRRLYAARSLLNYKIFEAGWSHDLNKYCLTESCSTALFIYLFFLIPALGSTPLPSVIPTAILTPTRRRCHSNSCPGSYKMSPVCKDGYCVCTGQDYDYHTCLRKFFCAENQVQRPYSHANTRCLKEK